MNPKRLRCLYCVIAAEHLAASAVLVGFAWVLPDWWKSVLLSLVYFNICTAIALAALFGDDL